MDRELPDSVIKSKRIKKTAVPILSLAVLVLSIMIFRSVLSPTLKISSVRIAIAERGSIEDAVTASGTVTPKNEQIITCPIATRIEQVFHKAGDRVDKSESILGLNKEFVLLQYRKLADDVDLKINQKTKLKLSVQRQQADLRTQHEIMKLRIKFNESKLEMEEKLLNLRVGSKEAYDLARLSLEISGKELQYIEEQIENQEKSLEADLREHELQIQISKRNLEELERQLELAEVKSAIGGVVTWVNENIGASITPGEVVARVADLKSYRVEANISDIHADKLAIGRQVRVRIDKTDLPGRISSIRPTIKNGVVTFLVELKENDHPSLRSNLRVDVFVITDIKENVIRIENGPFVNGAGLQDIFMIEGKKAVRKTVNIGATNFDYVEITDLVEPGDEVIIADMEKYIHHKEIAIKFDK